MRIKYFQTAWSDIRNSRGWFGKLCLLALVSLIPIFGQIVLLGYLYGWAREIAWGVHEPLPQRIFGNEDGKLYRRGWFVLVVVFVFALVPSVVMGVGNALQGSGYSSVSRMGAIGSGEGISIAIGGILYLVGLVGTLFTTMLAWIAAMRVAIYDKLSAGFQLGVIWKMFRRDTGGIMRVLGMDMLVGFIIGFVISIVFSILFTIIFVAGFTSVLGSGYTASSLSYMTNAEATRFAMQFIAATGVAGTTCFALLVYVAMVAGVLVQALVVRAMGYWTLGFDVPNWRGKDDPLPFEVAGQPSASYAAPATVPYASQQPQELQQYHQGAAQPQQGAAQPQQGAAQPQVQPYQGAGVQQQEVALPLQDAQSQPFVQEPELRPQVQSSALPQQELQPNPQPQPNSQQQAGAQPLEEARAYVDSQFADMQQPQQPQDAAGGIADKSE